MSDNVNHPQHYIRGGIETIDVIKAFTSNLVGMEAVCTANALKYLCRWKEKNGVEDLKKAEWYLKRLISEVEAVGDPVDDHCCNDVLATEAVLDRQLVENESLADICHKFLQSRARVNAIYALHLHNAYEYDLFINWCRKYIRSDLYKGTVLIDYHGTNFENEDIAAYDAGKIDDYDPYDLPERSQAIRKDFNELWLVCPTSLSNWQVTHEEDGRTKAPDEVRFEICIFDRELPSPKTLNTLFYGGDSGPIKDVVALELFDRS